VLDALHGIKHPLSLVEISVFTSLEFMVSSIKKMQNAWHVVDFIHGIVPEKEIFSL